jgi:effector-binding domain-containing protein
MEYKIELIQTEDQPTICIRTTTRVENLPPLIGNSYCQIMEIAGKNGINLTGAPYIAYFNMDMENLQVEMGFPVDKTYEAMDNVVAGVIPAGKKITTLYTGPYEQMVPAYEQLTQWAKDHSQDPTGVSYEYYLNGPETPPEQLQTRIVFPIK